MARDRRAALRDGDPRRRDRRRDDGHAAGRRDAVRRLRLVRLGPPRHRRRQAALARRHAGADRAAAARRAAASRAGRSTRRTRSRRSRTSPGLKCVCPATPEDAKGLLVSAIEDPNPVLFFEHKHLYRRIKGEVPDERYTTPIGEARIHREGDDVTVVTWGAMVYTAEEAADAARRRSRSRSSTCARSCRGTRRPCSSRCARPRRCSCCTRTRTPAASAPRSRPRSPRRRSRTSTRRRGGSPRPTRPVPFSPALEEAFIPQVDDVVAGAPRAGGVLDGDRHRRRRRHAADGRLRLRGDGHEVAEGRRRARSRPTSRCSRSRPTRSTPRCRAPARASSRRSSSRRARRSTVGTLLARIGAGEAAAPAEPRAPSRCPSPPTEPEPPTRPSAAAGEPRAAPEPRSRRSRRRPEPPAPAGNGSTATRHTLRLAGRRADRRRARGRPGAGRGHRPRRPRDEEGHPGLRRVGQPRRRRPRSRAGPAPPPPPGEPAAPPLRRTRAAPPPHRAPPPAGADCRGEPARRDARADERDAPRHRRAHAPLARHRRARHERDRGRHVEGRRDPRAAEGASTRHAYGVNPTYLAFVARATVETLRDWPWVNAEIRGESIVTTQLRQPRLRRRARGRQGPDRPGAEARRGPEPARHGPRRSPTSPSARATKKLLPDDVQGGTFTITNPGGFGTFHGTPIISQPQSGDPRHLRAREAAVGDQGRRRQRRDRDPADHEPHAHLRPPPRRRRLRRRSSCATCARSSRAGAKATTSVRTVVRNEPEAVMLRARTAGIQSSTASSWRDFGARTSLARARTWRPPGSCSRGR